MAAKRQSAFVHELRERAGRLELRFLGHDAKAFIASLVTTIADLDQRVATLEDAATITRRSRQEVKP